jgi:hypothetical protein
MTLQLGTALELDGFDATLLDALTSQRSRMEKTFTGFDGWSGSTRCSAWKRAADAHPCVRREPRVCTRAAGE